MANVSIGQGTLMLDLIDDLGVDAVSFHDEFTELHRSHVFGREPVFYGPGWGEVHMHAKAWAGKACVYVFETVLIPAGEAYVVDFDV